MISKKGQGRMSLAFFMAALRRRRRPEALIDRAYPAWARRDRPDPAVWRALIAGLRHTPRFSIVMPVHETDSRWLAAAVQSVRAQFYADWELLIADDASQSPGVRAYLASLAGDERIDVQTLPARQGISAASNAALARAQGDYVTFLDHDDLLAPHALAAAAVEIAATPSLDLLFSDEDQIVRGRRASPYFKPGWNPDLLLSQNAVCHLAIYRRALVTAVGGLRPAHDGSQDYDLALRAAADLPASRVRHIPLVLYHWRQSPGSFSATAAARCADAARRALADHLGARAIVATDPALPQWPAVRMALPGIRPLVSIIGPRIDTGHYDKVEFVAGPAQAAGSVLVWIGADMQPMQADWLEALVAQALRPEIGAAGGRITNPQGALLHAGYQLHPKAVAFSWPAPGDAADPGYRGQFRLARSVSAVSAQCLAVRRAVFEAAGGFTAASGDFQDVDLCLRLAARGLRTVWVPQAWLMTARLTPQRDGSAWMRARWADALQRDLYGNANLALSSGRVRLVSR
jgi:GT2 family glycosyltransferase